MSRRDLLGAEELAVRVTQVYSSLSPRLLISRCLRISLPTLITFLSSQTKHRSQRVHLQHSAKTSPRRNRRRRSETGCYRNRIQTNFLRLAEEPRSQTSRLVREGVRVGHWRACWRGD
jgi:hypothetical protein